MSYYKDVADGEWVRPAMKNYLAKCCDCGLVHKVNYRVVRQGRGLVVEFQAFRHAPRKSNTKRK